MMFTQIEVCEIVGIDQVTFNELQHYQLTPEFMTMFVGRRRLMAIKLQNEWPYTLPQILIWWEILSEFMHLPIGQIADAIDMDTSDQSMG